MARFSFAVFTALCLLAATYFGDSFGFLVLIGATEGFLATLKFLILTTDTCAQHIVGLHEAHRGTNFDVAYCSFIIILFLVFVDLVYWMKR